MKRKAKLAMPLVMVNVWILVQGTETNYNNLRIIIIGVEKFSETEYIFLLGAVQKLCGPIFEIF